MPELALRSDVFSVSRGRLLTALAFGLLIGLAGLAGILSLARAHAPTEATGPTAAQILRASILPIEEFYADNGTYTGMNARQLTSYDLWNGVVVRFARGDHYCIQTSTKPVYSRAGSLAPVKRGPCTRSAALSATKAHDGVPPEVPKPNEWLSVPVVQGRIGTALAAPVIASRAMLTYWLDHGSYVGATPRLLAERYGRTTPLWLAFHVGFATATSYCVWSTVVGVAYHRIGPGGHVRPGSCPSSVGRQR
jgi:hypothetical protein